MSSFHYGLHWLSSFSQFLENRILIRSFCLSCLICRGLVVWRVLLYLFGLPILGFSILLVIRLQWCPTLNLFLVFIPLWFMDCNSTVFVIM